MAQLSQINRSQLTSLLKLRGKLTVRQYAQERGRIVIAILVIFLVLPMAVGAAIGTTIGYMRLPAQWPTALMGGVLVVLWLLWATFPVFVSSINEALDITRLMQFPISRRTLIANMLLGTLFDYPTYFMLPLLLAILIGFGFSAAFPVVIIALVLSYGHLVLIGQLVSTAIGGILQSRRVRDATIIFMSLLGGSCYFINLATQRFMESVIGNISGSQREVLMNWQPLNILQWLPPGAAARAIERATVGEWLLALLWLFYSAAWLAVITWAWYQLLARLTTGGGYLLSLPSRPDKKEKPTAVTVRTQRDFLSWLPDDLASIAHKELVSVWRLPQRRVAVIQGFLFPIIMGGAYLLGSDFTSAPPRWLGLVLPLYALFIFWATTQNMMAWEGKGLPSLLVTPIARERILLSKGMVLAAVAALPYLIIGLGLSAVMRNGLVVLGVLTGLCMGVATVSVTAVTSVIFPIPINLESRRQRGAFQSGGSFSTGCASVTIVPLAILLVSLPAYVPLGLTYWLERPWIGFVGAVFAIAYALFAFRLGTQQAGKLLLEREPEFLMRMKTNDE